MGRPDENADAILDRAYTELQTDCGVNSLVTVSIYNDRTVSMWGRNLSQLELLGAAAEIVFRTLMLLEDPADQLELLEKAVRGIKEACEFKLEQVGCVGVPEGVTIH